jgi:Holliday junction resolvase RusA-like endonuclease
MPEVTTYVDQVPPSSNTNTGVGGRGHPKGISRTKKEWEGIFQVMLMQARVPRRLDRIHVKPRLQFRTKNRRDADNFYFAVGKPLGDALVKGGWLVDDDYTRYEMERVEIEVGITELPPLAKGRTTLLITYETQPRPWTPPSVS